MARSKRAKTEDGSPEKEVELTVEGRLARLETDFDDFNLTSSVQAKDIQTFRARLEKFSAEIDDIAEGASAEDLERVESNLANFENRLQEAEASLVSRTADIESFRENFTKLESEDESVKTKVAQMESSLEERLSALKEEVGQSDKFATKEEVAELKAEMPAKLAEMESQNASLRESMLKEQEETSQKLRSDLDQLRTEFKETPPAVKTEDFEAVSSKVEEIKAALDGSEEVTKKLKDALAQVEELQKKLDELEPKIDTVEPKFKAVTSLAEDATNQVTDHLDAIKMAMRLVEQLEERVKTVTQMAAQPIAQAPQVQVVQAKAAEVVSEDEEVPPVPEDLGYDLGDILQVVFDHGASDLHLKAGTPPTVRLHGDLVPVGNQILSPSDSKSLIYSAMTKQQRHQLVLGKEVDFAYQSDNTRFRVNAFLERGQVSAAFRMLRSDIPPIEDLGLPPVIKKLASLNSGMILVTGPAGSGKSTTLAACVDYINTTRKCHVVTIEDPIEFFHKDKMSIVTQREVGSDTSDFAEALKMSLRQDPNVIMVGEMRDAETIMTAITAAETGHLVISTLHTPNAVQAVDRIIDTFSGDLQKQFRLLLANCLKGVVSQKLLNRQDGKGRIAACEVMVVTPTISSLILEAKTNEIYPYIQQGSNDGMQTFTQSMLSLYTQGFITKEEGLFHADQPTEFRMGVEGHATSTNTSADISDETLMNWL